MSLGIAYAYARLGFAVFPLAPNSKIPLISKSRGGRGCHDATVDRERIEAWWAASPHANVAIATGPASACWVLDVDPNTSPEGEKWLADMEAANGALPPTPEARTLKGGRHLLFKWNDAFPVGNRVNFACEGIDARGDGGYIVAAPSFVSEHKHGQLWEGKYEWLDGRRPSEVLVADAPDWLLQAVIHKAQAQTATDFVPRERREGDGFAYGHKALDIECQAIMTAVPGGQDNQIVSSAYKIGQLVEGGEIPRDEAEDLLINAAMAIPGQSKKADVIRDKVKRAMTAGGQKPRRAETRPMGRPQLRVVGGQEKVDPETGEVIAFNSAPDEPELDIAPNWAMGLDWALNDEGKRRPMGMNNIRLMLTYHPGFADKFQLNRFSYKVWITGELPCDNGEVPTRVVQDYDYVSIASWMNTVGLTPSDQMVAKQINLIATRNDFDPVEDFLLGLKWDGKPRINDWLTYYAGVEKSAYTSTVGPKFLISAVARVLRPGCKVDTMLVLEGPQGLKKSTLARALFGSEWFSDQVGDVTSKESSIQIQGLWCVEVSEMDSFSRADDKAVKSFLSRIDDRYRPTYGLNTVERPRRCVFIGTYNPDGSGIIKDATGARRYWFATCSNIEIEAVLRDREQLWAEAVHRFQAGESWWLEKHEEDAAKVEQAARQEQDLWDDSIEDWIAGKFPGATFRLSEIVKEALNIPVERRDIGALRRLGKILTRLGCVQVRPYDTSGKQYRAWMKPEILEKEDE